MLITLDTILQRLGAEGKTIYKGNNNPFLISDHLALCHDYERYHDFPLMYQCDVHAAKLTEQSEKYAHLKHELLSREAEDAEISKTAPVYMVTPEKQAVRRAIKQLRRELQELEAEHRHTALRAICGMDTLPEFITYKNHLALNTYETIASFIPALKELQAEWIWEKPLFTRNIGELSKASSLAICGGPCLYGSAEMLVTIKSPSGEQQFDYHNFFYRAADTEAAAQVFAQATANDVKFTPLKRGITPQDYEIFDGLFQLAKILDTPLVVMFPDDAYLKFFDNMIAYRDAETREALHAKYERALYDTCDIYLRYVERFYDHFKPREFAVFHKRNKDLLDLYYKKREPYIQKSRGVTTNLYKADSILDYISMPALPFYIWNSGTIVNLDSVEETDPMRKCMHCHKGAVNQLPIMMTEKISRNGSTSYYESTLEWKDYISLDDLKFTL
ncbi:MAG: hypothetical protein LBD22_07790 [Spirochaetaceae bacterium]|jgi:hypothetical protein|nr:hypothetical protein [Spirochaetaceae bacterium]